MRAAWWQVERPARRHPEQATLGIEHVEEREQVALVGSAAVEEDEKPFGRRPRASASDESVHRWARPADAS